MDSIIFDVDGTLLDSRKPVRQAWGNLVAQLTGHPWEISDQDFTALFGLPMTEIAQRLFPQETDPAEQLRKAALCFDAELDWLKTHPPALFPGVQETLALLSRHYPLYIVSNCQKGYIEVTMSGTGLSHLFSGHLCFGDTGTPKGVTIRRLMEQHHLTSPCYVGDTQGDADACALAKVPFVYAAYGFGQVTAPTHTIQQFSELAQLVSGKEVP